MMPPAPMHTDDPHESANAARFAAQRDDVFGRIANRYDVLCDVFGMRLHRMWKRRVVPRIVAVHAGRKPATLPDATA